MKLLALAFHYPPNGGSGTHRSLHFLNHLAAAGDEVTVLTAREEDFSVDMPIDRELLAKVAKGIRVVPIPVARPVVWMLRMRQRLRGESSALPPPPPRAQPGTPASGARSRSAFQCAKDAITSTLTFPDEHVGWIPHVLRHGSSELRRQQADCIYSSGGPWSSHLAAALLSRRFRVPLVLDFRDPWASNPDREGRGRILRRCEAKLESLCIRRAQQVVLNTEPLRQDFIRRYPGEPADKFTTITNGFERILAQPRTARSATFTLVHAGEIYPPRNPASFLRTLRDLVREGAFGSREPSVRFIGGASNTQEVAALLAEPELQRTVTVIGRVPHSQVLRYQLEADVLLVFQTGFPLQVPRKLFEYMSMQKPVLAVAERDSATARIVEDSGVGVIAEQDDRSVREAVQNLYRTWLESPGTGSDQPRVLEYRNERLAQRLREVLSSAAAATGVRDA